MNRRSFLAALSALPLVGWMLPKATAPIHAAPAMTRIPGTENLFYLVTNDLYEPTLVMACDPWSKPYQAWVFTHHPDGTVTKEEFGFYPKVPA